MINGKTFLAIIPARGGSKRLPRKNILPLLSKPLIAWTIEAALKSIYIDEIIVTTDDSEIMGIAKKYGAVTPFLRPKILSNDTAGTFDVIKHAVDYYSKVGKTFDYIILLQPTSPMRTANHINEAISIINEKKADAVISVTEMEHSPLWSNILPDSGNMSGFLHDDVLNKRSQDLDVYYRLNGAIYICEIKKMLAEESLFLKNNVFAYKMEKNVSVDVDDKLDFEFCEYLLGLEAVKYMNSAIDEK